MSRMTVEIRVIPHDQQRYPTIGDWEIVDGHKTPNHLRISVSDLGDWRQEMAVAVHELIEALLCLHNGPTQEEVDAFDKEFERLHEKYNRGCNHYPACEEPGACPDAPYAHEHAIADVVERLLIDQFGLNWTAYESNVERVFDGGDHGSKN
jgi:hypothetical protein